MASVKVKFRPSTIEGKTGALYFQVIHRRIVRSQKTKYKIYPDEWNARTARITPSPSRPDRHSILSRYRHEIKQDLFRLSECIANLTRKGLPYSTDDLLRFYRKRSENDTLTGFMTSLICHLKEQGRIRTGETYQCALNSFMRFRNGEEIILDEMNQETIEAYEAYLKKERLSLNRDAIGSRNTDTYTFLVSHHGIYTFEHHLADILRHGEKLAGNIAHLYSMHLMGHDDMVGSDTELSSQTLAVLGNMLGKIAAIFVDIEFAIVALAHSTLAGSRESHDTRSYAIYFEH